MHLPENILIVEDESLTQRYLKDILFHCHVKTTDCYDNAEDVLKQMKLKKYDMILMDINIKGPMDGIQLAKIILKSHINLPIVFITAHSDSDTFEEVLRLSPYGFISKPFSARDVEVSLYLAYDRYITQKLLLTKKEIHENIDTIIINKHYKYSKTLMCLYHKNKPVKLNKKQAILIDSLCRMHDTTITFEILIDKIWGTKEIADNALRTLVYTLRKSLPDFPISSYSKVGYSLLTE